MARRILIEYTQDAESYSESRHEGVPIEKGTRRWVDPASAASLCSPKRKGGAVAKLVTEGADAEERAELRAEVKAAAPKSEGGN